MLERTKQPKEISDRIGKDVIPRLQDFLSTYSTRYPGIWEFCDVFYSSLMGQTEAKKPRVLDLCYIGSMDVDNILDGILRGAGFRGTRNQYNAETGIIACAASWRLSQGIYDFDKDVFEQLWNTPFNRKIPREVLFRLPEFAIYINFPYPVEILGKPCFGVFVCFDYGLNGNESHIYLSVIIEWTTLEMGRILFPLPDNMTIDQFIEASFEENKQVIMTGTVVTMKRVMNLVLYICSENADMYNPSLRFPQKAKPEMTKTGPRFFVAKHPVLWKVGYNIYRIIEKAAAHGKTLENKRKSPCGHTRKAHWHGYYEGPRSDPRFVLKWIYPVRVGGEDLLVQPEPASEHLSGISGGAA